MVTVPETPRFIFRMPPDLRADLERIANQEHRKLANLIIHALREWVAMHTLDERLGRK